MKDINSALFSLVILQILHGALSRHLDQGDDLAHLVSRRTQTRVCSWMVFIFNRIQVYLPDIKVNQFAMAGDDEFDYDSAVRPLGDDEHPFGIDCPINRRIQAILVHYEICVEDVALLVQEDLHTRKEFKLANPDGNADQRQSYSDALGPITKVIRRSRMLSAFRRVLSARPFDAIPAPSQPSKRLKADDKTSSTDSSSADASAVDAPSGDASADSSAADSSAAGASAAGKGKSAAAPAKGKGKQASSKVVVAADDFSDISDDDLSNFSDSDDGGKGDKDDKDDKDDDDSGRKCSSRRDINSLFSDVASEKLRKFKRRFVERCEDLMDTSDEGTGYSQIIEDLRVMRDAIKPNRVVGVRRIRAKLLKDILAKLAKFAKWSASKRKWGLARNLHIEFSGLAGLSIFKRLDAAMGLSGKLDTRWECPPSEPHSHASSGVVGGGGGGSSGGQARRNGGGGGGSSSSSSSGGGGGSDMKPPRCYGCFQVGHYKSRCPNKNKK